MAADPVATLVWPPADAGGHALVADGVGEAVADGLIVRPIRAVLHRPEPLAAPAG